MRKSLFFALFFLIVSFSLAQRKKAKVVPVSYTEAIITKYTDSLTNLKNYYDSQWSYKDNDALKNPYYFRLFFQPTLYNNPVNQMMDNTWVGSYNRSNLNYTLGDTRDKQLARDSAMNSMLADFYVLRPELISITEQNLNTHEGLREEAIVSTPLKHEVSLAEKIKPAVPEEVVEPVKVISHRPNFWTFSANFSLQYMQNYASNNWYQGGDSYNSLLATANLAANYNFNNKIKLSNSLEVKLGFQTVRSDTIHSFHATTDQLRMVNKLELQAIKNWSYSVLLTSWTQMMPKYNNNSDYVYADFLSPFECNFGIGMNYNLNKSKFSLSVNISPLAFDFKYVDRAALETRYGLPARHHFRESYGSTITLNGWWKVFNELKWTYRMYYFTTYQKVQWEWENTFEFTINKFLSTKLYVYPRFDDTQKDEKGRYRIQLKQWLSLGFNYSF